jgi:hypothetical protein
MNDTIDYTNAVAQVMAHKAAKPRTTKVRISLVVTVDRDEYELNYGDATVAEIRDHITYSALDGLRAQMHSAGLENTARTLKVPER